MNERRMAEEKPQDPESKAPDLVEERLFKARNVLIFGPITQKLAQSVSERLLTLAVENDREIRIFINSQGGHVESGDTVHDLIRFIAAPVKVIGTGWVASAAAHIYLGAKHENRLCLPNTRFLLHQPSGGAGGQASDIAIQAREIIKTRQRINEIIAHETGQPLEKVMRDTERDHWMSAEEAKDYGVVGRIVTSTNEV